MRFELRTPGSKVLLTPPLTCSLLPHMSLWATSSCGPRQGALWAPLCQGCDWASLLHSACPAPLSSAFSSPSLRLGEPSGQGRELTHCQPPPDPSTEPHKDEELNTHTHLCFYFMSYYTGKNALNCNTPGAVFHHPA